MNKIKEELLLSLIFVGKWLALGFGAVGILYFAINLAYHKSYFEPRMDKFDLEIEELTGQLSERRTSLASSQSRIDSIDEDIEGIESGDLKEATEAIVAARSEMNDRGIKPWPDWVPFLENNPESVKVVAELRRAKDAKKKAQSERASLEDEREEALKKSEGLTKKINQLNDDIEEAIIEKKRAEVDSTGLWLWALSILGLT